MKRLPAHLLIARIALINCSNNKTRKSKVMDISAPCTTLTANKYSSAGLPRPSVSGGTFLLRRGPGEPAISAEALAPSLDRRAM